MVDFKDEMRLELPDLEPSFACSKPTQAQPTDCDQKCLGIEQIAELKCSKPEKPLSPVQYILRSIYPDQIQTDAECLLHDFYTPDPRDPLSCALAREFLDLGTQMREFSTMTH